MQFKVIKRLEAEEKGLLYFYTGKECKWGHNSPRFTRQGCSHAKHVLGMKFAVEGLCHECVKLMEDQGSRSLGRTFEQILEDWDETTNNPEVSRLPLLSGTKVMGYKVIGESLIDAPLYKELSKLLWVYANGYVKASVSKENLKRITKNHICYTEGHKYIHLHRVILDILREDSRKVIGDHINGDKKDNRTCNLRASTHEGNSFNSRINMNNTTGYIGVDLPSHRKLGTKRYRVKLIRCRQTVLNRSFYTSEEAARCYDDFLREKFPSEFNVYNFPEVGERSKDGNIRTE